MDDVPAISDLKRLRSSTSCPIGKGRATVPADQFHRRVSNKPGRKRIRLSVLQEIDWGMTLEIDEHRSIALSLAPGPFIDS